MLRGERQGRLKPFPPSGLQKTPLCTGRETRACCGISTHLVWPGQTHASPRWGSGVGNLPQPRGKPDQAQVPSTHLCPRPRPGCSGDGAHTGVSQRKPLARPRSKGAGSCPPARAGRRTRTAPPAAAAVRSRISDSHRSRGERHIVIFYKHLFATEHQQNLSIVIPSLIKFLLNI